MTRIVLLLVMALFILPAGRCSNRSPSGTFVAGDLNGDGIADIAIGAFVEDNSGTDRGVVHLFFGGSSISSAANVTLRGTENSAQFGYSVDARGDLDGDKIADVVVGARLHDAGGSSGANRGRVFIFLGRKSWSSSVDDTAASLILSGSEDAAEFGTAVNNGADTNNDGFHDLVVGAPKDDADGNSTDDSSVDSRGRVFVFRGGSSLDGTADVTLSGTEVSARLGAAVATLDFNADGMGDVMAGSPDNDADGNTTNDSSVDARGRVFAFYGSNSFGGSLSDSSAALTFSGSEVLGRFGSAIAGGGDANGDGWIDLLIGAPDDDGDGNTTNDSLERGRAFLFYGGGLANTTADVTFSGTENGAKLGGAVAAGEITGDTFSELILGASTHDAGGTDRGRVFVFTGSGSLSSSISDTSGTAISGSENSAELGQTIRVLGNVNNTGGREFMVGAPLEDASASDSGRVRIFFGGSGIFDSTADVTLNGLAASDKFGFGL